jgi:hypothetical protein
VIAALLITKECRRLGDSLAAGLQPAQNAARFSPSCSVSFLNAAYRHSQRTVSFNSQNKSEITEKARLRCLKTALKNDAE